MPKRFLLSFLTVIIGMPVAKAQVAVELEKMNVIYIGLRNPVNIVAMGHDKKDLVYETTEGCQLIQTDSGDYIKAFQRGDCKLLIKTKKGKLLDSAMFRVRAIPKPEAKFGTLESGVHSTGSISAQPGVYGTLGEGFAYEGVKYIIDSCTVLLITPFEAIQCRQKGTVLQTEVRSHLREVTSLYITDIHASNPNSGETVELSPMVIRSRDPIVSGSFKLPDFVPHPPLSLGTCRIERNIETEWSDEGKIGFVRSTKGTASPDFDFIYLTGEDTIVAISNGFYKHFSDSGMVIEQGYIQPMPDSVAARRVQSEAYRSLSVNFENDTALNLLLYKRFYPVGLWSYFHANGVLKAKGMYNFDDVESYHNQLEVVIRRSGTWLFYNENGELIHTIHYPE